MTEIGFYHRYKVSNSSVNLPKLYNANNIYHYIEKCTYNIRACSFKPVMCSEGLSHESVQV